MHPYLIKILLFLLISTPLLAQAILKLDTKGHTSLIRDVIVTHDKEIITASDDKTIRVWDSHTGREKRKILGNLGAGAEGMIFAIALSHDEKYLAVGGFLGPSGSSDKSVGTIRIYNYQTGKLLRLLKSHTDIINDLAFSKDSRYLISGSADRRAKIWDVADDFYLKDTINYHSDFVYGVKIIKKGSKYFAVTISYDKKVALYDIQKRRVIAHDTRDYKLSHIAINDKRSEIAITVHDKKILIYDYDLEHLKTIRSKTKTEGIAYSPNGKLLIVGSASTPRNINIYNADQDYDLKTSFTKHTNATIAVGFLDNNTAVSAGGSEKEMYIWDINSAKEKRKLAGVGKTIWSVAIDGDTIAWGNKWTGDTHTVGSKLQSAINLKNNKVTKLSSDGHFNRLLPLRNGSYSLSHTSGGHYGYHDGVLNIKYNGNIESKIVRTSSTGFRHRCYGWYKDYIISGGASGHIKAYDTSGKEVASFVGHTGEIWALSLDGDRLVSGSGDQTIKVWNLNEIGEHSTIKPMLNIFVSKEKEWVIWSESGYFNASVGGDKYVGYHINQGRDKEARYVGSDKYFDTLYRPDIIAKIVQTGSEKKAIAFANRTKKVQRVDVSQALPPVVSLLSSSNITTSQDSIDVRFSIESSEALKEVIILHNGQKVGTRGLKRKKEHSNGKSVTIPLRDGENIISIKARNKFAMSDEVLVYATKKSSRKNIYKPTLYLLSIGVSQYKNPEYNLGVADKDALAIAKMFKSQKGKVYKDVVAKTLTNSGANSDNILDALDWIDREVTSKDVAIIFIAGHGVNDDKGFYYFLSHDANLDRLRRTAVKWTELQATISSLPSKVILLADTCHSGNITGTRRDITSAVKSIINSGTGSVIMTATTGNGYSYEKKEWGHGAFTKSFLEGLGKMKADYDGDNTVTVKEIDLYITNSVKKLTSGKQKPTTIIPDSVPDFAIGVK